MNQSSLKKTANEAAHIAYLATRAQEITAQNWKKFEQVKGATKACLLSLTRSLARAVEERS